MKMQVMVRGRWNKHSSSVLEAKKLWKTRNDYDKGKVNADELSVAQDDLTRVFLNAMEETGVNATSSGGFRWDSIYDVARGFAGCEEFKALVRIPETNQFHRQPVVERPARVYAPEPVLLHDLNFSWKNTRLPLVYSLPGPYSLARQVGNEYQLGIRNLARIFASALNKEAEALISNGALLVFFDEPQILSHPEDYEIFIKLMGRLMGRLDKSKIGLATYFGAIDNKFPNFFNLPFGVFFVDLVEGIETISFLKDFPANKKIVAGLFDGRSPVEDDLNEVMAKLKALAAHVPLHRIVISTSSDLHFLPWDEAITKVEAMVQFARTINKNKIKNFKANAKSFVKPYRPADLNDFKPEIIDDFWGIKKTVPDISIPFPTSTVGSFPQYKELRALRASMNRGEAVYPLYIARGTEITREWIELQDNLDITVPVDGEFLREDMAAYFGERLGGRLGDFVPSYENRRYRPVIYDNEIEYLQKLTVADFTEFQAFTKRQLKATLTGPATLADWGLIKCEKYRNNPLIFRMDFAKVLREEISHLIAAGAKIIQIDEPALTTKMKYFGDDMAAIYETIRGFYDKAYLILHICYSDKKTLDEALPHIIKLPFHQIHMEMANRNYELLDLIDRHGFGGKDIGLGVIDVHTDRIETTDEILNGAGLTLKYFKPQQIWLTPDCGLKERSIEITKEKLTVMSQAAKLCREKFA